MTKHGLIDHVPRRRLLGLKPTRCRCGNQLPCVVQASINRQQYLNPEAAPAWNDETMFVPLVDPRPVAERPLMTPGQLDRTSQGGRW